MPIVTPRLIVELYEGWGFSGKCCVLTDSATDLREFGMFDRVFSARIFAGPGIARSRDHKAVFFDETGYGGNRLALAPGFYPNLQDVVRRFRTVRSVKMEAALDVAGPEWGDIPLIIEAYNREDFEGRRATIVRDVADLRTMGRRNTISSLRIHKGPNFPKRGCRVLLYSEPGFEGARLPIEMHPSDYRKEFPDLSLLPQSFGDRISSVSIVGWSDKSRFDTVVFEDEFAGATAEPGWEWRDPMGGGDWRAHQGYLRMNVEPGQDLWHGANFEAPRLLRRVDGDFAIETHMPLEASRLEHGGLLVWRNEHRFLRLEKTCAAHAFAGDVRCERHQWQSYELLGRGADLRDAGQLFLRVERAGDALTGHASADGHTWEQCGATVMGMSDPVYVGLHALAPGDVPATATRFSYFRILRKRADVRRELQLQQRRERAANTTSTAYALRSLR
ncbi:DUF1349 domain-containing protein [Candidatus Poribacteria bacterium]|jgi:regulation of enolase protein 1 (concanavalin A-like superfamily)|nr:DUF1349 domain-containing protein [Candidatus Poribacteria bacterium]MBT5713908.1 DUF1349 domain-containing protein [Candidatus Poribacteria bacterium]MBT7097284.1 DUF1349 domain-containing protein [Candidatus Poribacteria bacterium]MBT7808724.1 DUF1349 domain-containing protein [Candidatus Poribacteria bacterium]